MSQSMLPHVLFALLLVSRLGDVISTRLATPTLALEANPLVRRLGWRFALATLLLPLVAYFDTSLAMMVLVPSLLVTASNLSKGWGMRTMGENAYLELVQGLARRSRVWEPLSFLAGACVAVAGATLCTLEGPSHWGYWFGLGVIVYGAAMAVHGTAFILRLFKSAKSA